MGTNHQTAQTDLPTDDWPEPSRELDHILAFVGTLDLDGTLRTANRVSLQAAGLQLQDVVGKRFWDCYWWTHDAGAQKDLRHAISRAADGQHVRYDVEVQVADGQTIIIDFQLVPERTPDGDIARLIASGIDITERKRNERELARANATLDALFETAPLGIGIWDTDFRYLRVNRQLAEINGLPPGEHIGRRPDEILPDLGSLRDLYDVWQNILETGEPCLDLEIVGSTPAEPARQRSWDTQSFPIRIDEQTVGIATFVDETTLDKANELRLRESEGRLRHLFSVIDEGFCLCEMLVDAAGHASDYRILEVNPQFEEMTGLSDAVGRTALELVPNLETRWIEIYAKVGLGRETLRFEMESAEMARMFDVFATPVEPHGRFVIVFKDVTARAQAEKQRELLINELNHRVKNTLATIQSMASLTLRHAASPKGFQKTFQERLAAMATAHDVLFNEGDQGAFLRNLIVKLLAPYAADKPSRLKLKGPTLRLPAEAIHALALAIHELATNAAKYGALSVPEGQLDIAWQVLDEASGPRLLIDWRERGGPPVIAPEKTGFGSSLIHLALEYSIGGHVEIGYPRQGVEVALALPLDPKP